MCVGQDRVLNIHAVFLSRQQRPGAHHVLLRPEGQVIIFLKRPPTMDNIFHRAAIDRHKYQIIQYAVCIRTSLSEGRPGNNKINSRINLIDGNRPFILPENDDRLSRKFSVVETHGLIDDIAAAGSEIKNLLGRRKVPVKLVDCIGIADQIHNVPDFVGFGMTVQQIPDIARRLRKLNARIRYLATRRDKYFSEKKRPYVFQ